MNEFRAIELALRGTSEPPSWSAIRLPSAQHFCERFQGQSDISIAQLCLRGGFRAVAKILEFTARRDDPDLPDAAEGFIYHCRLLDRWNDQLDQHVSRLEPQMIGRLGSSLPVFGELTATSATALTLTVLRATSGAVALSAQGEEVESIDSGVRSLLGPLDESLLTARAEEVMEMVAQKLLPLPWEALNSAVMIEVASLVGPRRGQKSFLNRVTSPRTEDQIFGAKERLEYSTTIDANGRLTDNAIRVLETLQLEDDECLVWMTEGKIVEALNLYGPGVVKKVTGDLKKLGLMYRRPRKYGSCLTPKGALVLALHELTGLWSKEVIGTNVGTD